MKKGLFAPLINFDVTEGFKEEVIKLSKDIILRRFDLREIKVLKKQYKDYFSCFSDKTKLLLEKSKWCFYSDIHQNYMKPTPDLIRALFLLKMVKETEANLIFTTDGTTSLTSNCSINDSVWQLSLQKKQNRYKRSEFNEREISSFQKICKNYFDLICRKKEYGSLRMALEFFLNGLSSTDWRLEIPITSIGFDVLFVPERNNTFQFAKNISNYLERENRPRRKNLFWNAYQYYSIRSEIVHQGFSKRNRRQKSIRLFGRTAYRRVLRKILSSEKECNIFKDELNRKAFLLSIKNHSIYNSSTTQNFINDKRTRKF